MGARGTGSGVENHRGKCRVVFSWRGKRERVTLDLRYTKPNVNYAAKLRAEIVKKIEFGIFDPLEYFPNWKGGAGKAEEHTFEVYRGKFIAACRANRLADSTVTAYESNLRTHFAELDARAINRITFSDLAKLVGERPWQTEKTRNNALICLRGVFAVALADGVIKVNPTDGLKNQTYEAEEPDPLTPAEVVTVLGEVLQRYGPKLHNYFDFAISSGLRTSELIELQWPDIDWQRKVARVARAKVKGKVKVTKTKRRREVELSERALAALARQREHTLLAGKHIFVNPFTGEPFKDDYTPGSTWKRALASAGMRHRNAYQTRHMFATIALMAGANPMWVSKQLGHTSMTTMWKHYARWIQGADHGRERGKLDAAFAAIAPALPPQGAEAAAN
jgi:integrase